MTKTKLPPAKDWRNRAIADWTLGTFRAYLSDEHMRRYGIAYTARNYAVEGRFLKLMIAEHGNVIVREFIDACFEDYRPTRDYPGLNFAFMYSYMRARILPRVLVDHRRAMLTQVAEESAEDLSDWL